MARKSDFVKTLSLRQAVREENGKKCIVMNGYL